MKVIEYYSAEDHEAGFCANFQNIDDAKSASIGNGFYGADAVVSKRFIKIWDSYEEWFEYTHPTMEKTNPELYKVVKNLSGSELEILKKNGLKT